MLELKIKVEEVKAEIAQKRQAEKKLEDKLEGFNKKIKTTIEQKMRWKDSF